MSYYQRPLRPDELMHGHKYIDKVRTKSGAWRYIYDLAGGRYKKQATKHEAEAKRYQQISDHNYNKGRQYEKDEEINRASRDAYKKAYDDVMPAHRRKAIVSKIDEHQHKILTDSVNAYESYNKSNKYYTAARNEERKAKESKNKYKNSLAYEYDYQTTSPNSTLSKAKKQVNKGKNFFKKLLVRVGRSQ